MQTAKTCGTKNIIKKVLGLKVKTHIKVEINNIFNYFLYYYFIIIINPQVPVFFYPIKNKEIILTKEKKIKDVITRF
jgi:hypothetical protein